MKTPIKNKSKNEFKFKSIPELIQVLGMIESGGTFFDPSREDNSMVSHKDIQDTLSRFLNDESKSDWGRTIRNARDLFNELEPNFQIQGDRRGTHFVRKKDFKTSPSDLKLSHTYKMFTIFLLAFMQMNNTLEWDALHQLFQSKFTLGFLGFLSMAIEKKLMIRFRYKKDRLLKTETYKNVIPGKLCYRDGHWVMIGWEKDKSKWTLFLIHSIINPEPELDKFRQFAHDEKRPDLDLEKFFENSFGIAVLDKEEPIEIELRTPLEYHDSIVRRRKGGKWTKFNDHYIWKIKTFDPEEVFNYILRWNGIIQISGPKEMKKLFQEKLHKFLT